MAKQDTLIMHFNFVMCKKILAPHNTLSPSTSLFSSLQYVITFLPLCIRSVWSPSPFSTSLQLLPDISVASFDQVQYRPKINYWNINPIKTTLTWFYYVFVRNLIVLSHVDQYDLENFFRTFVFSFDRNISCFGEL